jgi:nucleotide-binding universal stress UspA family protein
LIVMGAHGLTGADKLLIGSTTAGILLDRSRPGDPEPKLRQG